MKTVLVCGSKHLTGDVEKKRAIARGLGEEIVRLSGCRLLTGGAIGEGDGATTGGVDFMAALGGRAAVAADEAPSRLLTVHPRDRDPAELFTQGTVTISRGRNTPSRRFELVARADAVVTIEGEAGTPKIIDYAIASGKPAIPIACTGGASADAWEDPTNREALLGSLGITDDCTEYETLHAGIATPHLVVETCIRLLRRVLRPRCFIIMPFAEEHSTPLYEGLLCNVLADEGYEACRADSLYGSRPIMDDIIEQLNNADLIIADISGNNPNVMFELGLASGMGKRLIILCRRERDDCLENLIPFDLKTLRVLPFSFLRREEFEHELRAWIRTA